MPRSQAEAEVLKRIQALADQMTPDIQRQVAKALKAVNDGASLAKIERALRTNDAFQLHDLVSALPTKMQPVAAALESLFLRAAEASKLLLPGAARIGMRFDSKNVFAQRAAKQYTFDLIKGVTQETRAAIRTLVVRGFQDGIPPRDLAKLIEPSIGLTERQAVAVAKLHDRLIAEGLSRTAAQTRVGAAAKRFRRLRAVTIARTEVIRASAQGQIAAWNEASGKGLLSANSEMVWITTPDDRLCRFCLPMDGQTAMLGSKFKTLLGRVDGPPLHPNCRCAISIQPKSRSRISPQERRFSTERQIAPPISFARARVSAPPPVSLSAETKVPVGSGKKQLTAEQKAKKASQSRAYRERVKAAKDALMRAIPAQPKWPISDDVVRYQGLRYPAQLEREYETWVKSLTPEEYNAVSYYTSSGYVPINEFLRTGKATGAYTAHEVKTRVDAIESALFKARDSVKPELVWRGLPDKKGMEFVDSVAFGDVITMKGFQSTSISPGFAHSWSPGTRSALFEIKPTRGAYIRQISDHQEELEFLLPHDAKYRVVGKTRVKIQRHGEIFERPVIQLEMLQ